MSLPLRADTMIEEAIEAYRNDRLELYQRLRQIDNDVHVEFSCSLSDDQPCSAYISMEEIGQIGPLPEKYELKLPFPNPHFGLYSSGDILHAAAQIDVFKRSY